MASKNFSLFLALRYIRPKRTFVSIITVISILGVTLGVMVLILVLSVMTGFQRELEEKIVGFEAHAVVNFANKPSDDWWNVMQLVKKQKDVVGVAPYVMGPVLVEFNKRHVAPQIRAIDPELETSVTDIRKYIIDGEYDLDGDKTILGSELAAILACPCRGQDHHLLPEESQRDRRWCQRQGDRYQQAPGKCLFPPNWKCRVFLKAADTSTTASSSSCRCILGRKSTTSAAPCTGSLSK